MTTLSCGGGGVRGKIVTTFLTLLQKDLESTLYETFDVYAGTSTGSLISSALACNYKIDYIDKKFYNKENLQNIFTRSWRSYLFGVKFRHEYIYDILDSNFNININDIYKKVFIITYNYTKRVPKVFSNEDNILLSDVLKSAIAAPTYFPPYQIDNDFYIDGTVCCNNPNTIIRNIFEKKFNDLEEKICNFYVDDMDSVVNNLNDYSTNKEIKILINEIIEYKKLKDGKILFIGTGYKKPESNVYNIRNWGIVDWYKNNIIDLIMNGDEELNRMETENIMKSRYLHINTELYNDMIDDVSDDNIDLLEEIGKDMYAKNKDRVLEFLCI